MTEESFFARWSRLKAAELKKTTVEAAPLPEPPPLPKPATTDIENPDEPASAEPAPAVVPPTDALPAADAPFDPASLPPVESLTAESDFKPFLQDGVPKELKTAALRQLWRSDPVLAAPEVLDLHNLDYTLPAVPEVVHTAYRVGKGFLDAAEAAEEKASAATEALGESAPTGVSATPTGATDEVEPKDRITPKEA